MQFEKFHCISFSLNVQYDIYTYQINIASGKCIHDDNFDDSGSNAIK